MFELRCIELENFKSYRGKHDFSFPKVSGLYFLTGDNKKEPSLQSNGSGKSTLLDAIFWCLYGRSLRGLKAADIVSWDEKGASVTLVLGLHNSEWVITRTQGPNSLRIDGDLVEQQAINKLLGLEPDGFQRSVIMAQFNEPFLDLGPTDKLGLFSQIMNLDYWLEHSTRADKKSKEILTSIEKLEKFLMAVDASIHATESSITDYLEQEGVYDIAKKEEQKKLKTELKQYEKDYSPYAQLDLDYITQIKTLETALDQKQAAYKAAKVIEKSLDDELQQLKQHRAVLNTKNDAAEADLAALDSLETVCPNCLQKVDKAHLKKEIKEVDARLSKIKTDKASNTACIEKLNEEIDQVETELCDISVDIDALNLKIKKLRDKERLNTIEQLRLKSFIESRKRDIDKLSKEQNPYIQPRLKATAGLAKYREDKEINTKTLKKLEIEYETVNYWVQGFKRVRLFIIEETLRTLEAEVNSCLVSLGLTGWSIEFDVERENKSGGITKGFVVLIKAPSYDHPIKWESWSGGEAQRLTLAADLGLANLIMQQSGLQNKIEFYDEPSKHLSKAGLMDLAETLHQRAVDDGKVIFLVDHNMPEFGEFAGVIKVIKDVEGNSTIQLEGN
ncbi:MAG TPA: hypothetical protein VFR24_27265 [Candidatus Angelobacter sp.]|nr:hypothetical protein [Candidatus Angelobacter sp.]